MRLLPAVFANFLLILAALGVGSLLVPLFPRSFRMVDRLAAVLLGGLGSLGTLLFLVGLMRFSLTTILAILVPATLLGIYYIWNNGKSYLSSARSTHFPLLPTGVVVLVMFVTFVGGLTEPIGDFVKSDAIAYHYLGPQVWLRDSVIHPVPDESLTSFPAVVETLFASLMATGGPRAMALFSFPSLGVLLLVSYGFALRLKLDSSGAWWTTVLVAAMPAVYRSCYDGFIDAVLWSFVLLSLRLALDAEGWQEFALSGFFSGLAMGTKYHGIIAFALILACAFLLHSRRDQKSSVLLAGLVILSVVACAVACPWYLRNWITLGSPIYPPTRTMAHFFHVKYMSPQAINYLGAVVDKDGLGMGHDFLSFLLLPFRMTFHPANYLNGAGGVGLALLTLGPFGILLWWRSDFVKVTVLFMLLSTIAWFVTEQDVRFLIHVVVILACFSVWGWHFVAKKAPRFGSFLAAFTIGCSILYGLIMILPVRASDFHAAVSSSYEQQRKYQEVPFLDSFNYLNSNSTVKKVLILEPLVPTYYLEKDYLKPVGRFGEETIPDARDSAKLLGNASALGITHILDVRLQENGFRVREGQPNLALAFERADQRVYRVTPTQK